MTDVFIKRELDIVKLGPKHREHVEKHLLYDEILITVVRKLKTCKNLLSMYQLLFDIFLETYFHNKFLICIIYKYLNEEQKIEIEKELNEVMKQ